MTKFALALLASIFVISSIDACVTYSPSTGTYVVDKSGEMKAMSPMERAKL